MSEDSDSISEEERSLFRPFTRESLAAIEARIAEEYAKQKELEKKRAEGEVRPAIFLIQFAASIHVPSSSNSTTIFKLAKHFCSFLPSVPPTHPPHLPTLFFLVTIFLGAHILSINATLLRLYLKCQIANVSFIDEPNSSFITQSCLSSFSAPLNPVDYKFNASIF